MARLLKLVFWCLLLTLLLSPLALFYLGLSSQPMALPPPHLNQDDLNRLQRLLFQPQNADADQGAVTVTLGERELNTAASYGLQTAKLTAVQGLVVSLEEQRAQLRGSIELPLSIERRHLNLSTTLQPRGKSLNILQLKIGYLPLPGALLRWCEQRATDELAKQEALADIRAAWDAVQQIEIRDYQLHVTYRDSAALRDSVVAQQEKLLLERVDSARVDKYLAHLEPISKRLSSNRYPLLGLMGPAYELAQQRTAAGQPATMENAAALVSLAMYTADPALLEFIRLDDRIGYPSRRLLLTLHRRRDLAQHFITSALISLLAGDKLAEAAGLQKELADTETQSGFDLADLMADKAGIRFAELASSPGSAAQLQADVTRLVYDDDLLPSPRALPQEDIDERLATLQEDELEPYLGQLNRQITRLLAGVPLYRY